MNSVRHYSHLKTSRERCRIQLRHRGGRRENRFALRPRRALWC